MKITDKQIEEIAEELECGMVCFYHRPTGTIESYPDFDDPFFEAEPWQDIIDKIENDAENYDRFEKMDSTEGFQVMENFAYSLTDINFRDQILDRLEKRKPFRNFKFLVESSNYRQDWFDFRKQANIEFVKQQIKMNN